MSVVHETLTFTHTVTAPLSEVWNAYADPVKRAVWSVPAGEAQVYDEADFRVGGRDIYRCGPPDTLEFHGILTYVQIVAEELIVHTDTVTTGDHTLATALLTWEFAADGDSTVITLTDQVVSFVGAGMIDGHRNGHAKALEQLSGYLGQQQARG